MTHPWRGLAHDGLLYALQAMRHAHPSVFAADPFFAGGSQDDFTLFGRAYGALAALTSLPIACITLWVLAQGLWIATLARWAGATTPPRLFWPACLAMFSAAAPYGSEHLFHAAESFVTGRAFAEPITLAALLLFWSSRHGLGVGVLLIAMVIHPLMALPGLLAGGLMWLLQRWEARPRLQWRPVVLMGLTLTIGLIAVRLVHEGAGTKAMTGLAGSLGFRRIDPDWSNWISSQIGYALIENWSLSDGFRSAFPIMLLVVIARISERRLARLWISVAAAGLAGLAMAAISSWLRWELGLQIQAWRFTWIAALLAPLALISALPHVPSRHQRLVLAAGIPALVLSLHGWFPPAPWLQLGYVIVLVACVDEKSTLSDPMRRRLGIWTVLILSSAAVGCGLAFHLLLNQVADRAIVDAIAQREFLAKHFGWLLLLGVLPAVEARPPNRHAFRGLALLAVVGLAALTWDGRSRNDSSLWQMSTQDTQEWTRQIPMDAAVYWPGHPERVWFGLGRTSYASIRQLNGSLMFSREASEVIERRLQRLGPLAAPDRPHRSGDAPGIPDAQTTRDWLTQACQAEGLSYVVVPRTSGTVLDTGDPAISVAGESFALHRCGGRTDASTPPTPSPPSS